MVAAHPATVRRRGILDSGISAHRDGFAEVVVAHSARLLRLACLLTGDTTTAEDVVAEAYAKVWPKYKNDLVEDLGPYLSRAVVNVARNGIRRRVLERRPARDQSSRSVQPGFDEETADASDLWPVMLQLPLNQRAVLVLRFVNDLSEQETASLLGIPPGTVKSRTARGLEHVRFILEDGMRHG